MSTQTIHSILNRAVKEADFRGLLFSDPETVLAGYDLTEAETATLKNLTPETFDAASGGLEQRVSMAINNVNNQNNMIVGDPIRNTNQAIEVQPSGF